MSPESMSLSQIRPTEAKFLSSPGENENENKNKNIRENNFWSISDSYLWFVMTCGSIETSQTSFLAPNRIKILFYIG